MKRIKTHITLHESVKIEAQRLAADEGRSLSEVIERLLEREIERVRLIPRKK